MSKKLLIAVLTLGLVFAISGAVIGGVSHEESVNIPLLKVDPTAPRFNDLKVVPQHDPEINRPLTPGTLHPVTPTKMYPPDYYCDGMSYGDALAYYWHVPGDDYAEINQNIRFTSVAGYNCTLHTAYIAVYPSQFVGTPDMEVLVWDDDGFGYPGTLRGSVTIPYASLPTGTAYAVADLTSLNLVYSNEAEYHIGVNCPNSGAGNALAILSDDGTSATGRGSMYIPSLAGWYSYGGDYAWTMAVDYCAGDIPYSECYEQEYNCDPWYVWNLPDSYGDDYFNMRFSVGGPETLKTVEVAFYDAGDQSGDVDIFVWGSDAGFPDLSNVMYQTTVAFGDIVYYPNYVTLDLSAENIVPRSDFHIGWSPNDVTGGLTYGISDDGSCGTLRSSEYYGSWGTMLGDWGADVNFLIKAYLCKDEFTTCMYFENVCSVYSFNIFPSGSPDGTGNTQIGVYGGYDSWGVGCRLETIYIAFYKNSTYPDLLTTNSDIEARASDGLTWNGLPNAPGTLLGTVTITPAEYQVYPALTAVDFTSFNIRFDSRIWVGAISASPDKAHGIGVLIDDGTCGGPGRVYMWDDNTTSFSTAAYNSFIDIDVCCTPPPELTCTPGEDWPTSNHDFRRTGHSFNGTGDARCKQDILWWVTDAAGMNSNRPVIYDGKLIVVFNTKMVAYDINTGAVLWTISGMPTVGSAFRNTPTVADGYVYFGGGNIPAFNKADVTTGALVWSRTITTTPLTGNTQYTNSVIVGSGIFFQTVDGKLQGLDLATGANLTGYPIQLNGVGEETITSNGVDAIYVGTDGSLGANGYGSLYAIEAATGTILWQLDEADLAGHDLDNDTLGTVTKEVFRGPIAVDDDGTLYVMSSFASEVDGNPAGARYRIASDGTIKWAVNGVWQGTTSTANGYTAPILDANNVIYQQLRYWTAETGGVQALDKLKGKVQWTGDLFYTETSYIEGAMSCEPIARDLLYAGNNNGNFMAKNCDNGITEFGYQYYVGSGKSYRSTGIAIDPTHVVFTNRNGDVYVMSEQVDRPRLVILKTDELQSVPFFSPVHYSVTFDDVFMNNGCADLTGTLTADEAAAGFVVTSVEPKRIARLGAVADQMVENSYPEMARHLQPVDWDRFEESGYSKDSYSNVSAYAPPAWLWSITNPNFTIGEGETYSVTYDVNGPLVTRGPHSCYVTIASNDQYFMNETGSPVIQLGVLGGCLESTVDMAFGTTDQNVAPVMSTSEIGNQDVTLWDIDGANAWYWQGGFVYGMSQKRMAFNLEGWSTSDPADLWNFTLPDVNCFNSCTPYVTALTPLGAMSHDGGATYDVIEGYIGVSRYIDSLLDLACGGSWDWYATDCPFSNDSTIGLAVDQFAYGVSGEPTLNNVVIFRHNVTERNGRALPNVYFGALQDFDLENNAYDVSEFDAAHSVAWGASCYGVDVNNTWVAGMGKIPMDVDPMIGVRTLDAQQAMWNDGIALDSLYYFMTTQPGKTWQTGIDANFPCASGSGSDDREMFFSFVGHNFAANETYTYGTYMFMIPNGNVQDAAYFTDLATLVNQFAGFGRGDINNDGAVNLVDVVALYNQVNAGGNGPLFQHLSDVNNDGGVNNADVLYLANYWFCAGPAPVGSWVLPIPCP